MSMRHHQRGDTLVEVTIAIAIISSVIGSIIYISGAAFRLGETARQRTEAASLLQQEAELIRNERDNDIVTLTSSGWTTFLHKVFLGASVGPACAAGGGTGDIYTFAPAATFVSGNVWSPSGASYSVQTSQSTYTITSTACSLGTAPGGGSTNDIRFAIHITWTGADGQQQQGDLDTDLVDISGINQLVPSL
jgi:type II secretory pathway pseudopilin PulG